MVLHKKEGHTDLMSLLETSEIWLKESELFLNLVKWLKNSTGNFGQDNFNNTTPYDLLILFCLCTEIWLFM